MSSYTMPLKEVIELLSENEAVYSTRDRIEKGRLRLFDFDYPMFDENYKKIFETHFIRKFYMREIGFETEGLFKFNLESWLLINMPYFNKLFESELIQFDPLSNTKIDVKQTKRNDKVQTNESETTGNNEGNATSNTTGTLSDTQFNRHLESTNPDSRLAITTNDGKGVIEYASKIDEQTEKNNKSSSSVNTGHSSDTTNVKSTGNGSMNETEDFIESRLGKTGDKSFAKMLNEYRDSFLRIENKIFDEMQELFMLVY